jgi:hypothetical protein
MVAVKKPGVERSRRTNEPSALPDGVDQVGEQWQLVGRCTSPLVDDSQQSLDHRMLR